ncbi:diaminopimelate decarboxylase [Larsenimonas suaedae]|uniref:Diaminopimelate decarboxylase n=1 Tax=Larsenimonas suaedae TaxID=1851019 RepID=A0ABU1GZW8_9GAMM|nr:diaminopimelate decarboxylase [Larsenimonas suaedae]MCM2973534.1 diaminopimelate decarboxylase [Larsenimonas suaedae]MDR5897096.1 diaminopimelate decarboxylase [Larsenimonas suaedae]
MSAFDYKNGQLHAEHVALSDVADQVGTPCYVYSRAALTEHFKGYQAPLEGRAHLICYAVKTNGNLAVLDTLARLGAGFDIVSIGELERVIAAGGDPSKVVFSGVAKQRHEMARALELGIKCFNVESSAELERLNDVAAGLGKIAPVSLRVNPDVDAGTHPYISTGLKDNKFGVAIDDALATYQRAQALSNVNPVGLDCHIGSQLTEIAPFLDALDRLKQLMATLKEQGITLKHLDLGGGLGVNYQGETPPATRDYIEALIERLDDDSLELIFEPGRSIAANAGVMLTRVEYLKPGESKHFAIVDAGMNDLIRPSLYQAYQGIVEVDTTQERTRQTYDVVGPVCESGDFLGKERTLAIAEGDLLAVQSAGAYGFVMASTYNARPLAAEVMVDGEAMYLIRERAPLEELWAGESRLPEESH